MKEEYRKVLVLGSAALKIGEAGEFDYSGSQAIKALKEEGIYTILVNPNIATIQTSDYLADQVYFLPVNAHFVEKVIEKERPDGILLSFGGQTALNTGLELHRLGILDQYQVEVLGTPIQAIVDTEDRDCFVKRLQEIGVKAAKSHAASSVEDAIHSAREIGYPLIIRIAYALGGLGSGICRNEAELRQTASKALSYTPQILIEESLQGWKEIEYEVVRDRYNNCITVCNMENFDPMGIHTGESIVVAPSQTLSNREYHLLREIAMRVIRHLGIVGECNIQYALHPKSEDYRVIEVNARLSRSSALASKATGYPLAFVAAKLAIGHGLHELDNAITKTTPAFFEPALDYVVVKIPRWDLKKFRLVSRQIGSGMKSVGEVMAIGRLFEEALQKGLRMLQIGAEGLVANVNFQFENLKRELKEPTEQRIFAIVEAIKSGMTINRIHRLSHIDKWFLFKIRNVVEIEQKLQQAEKQLPVNLLLTAKKAGFSDKQIAIIQHQNETEIQKQRHQSGIRPFIRQIDTLAAEYPAQTNYLYLTYEGIEDDIDVARIPHYDGLGNPSIIRNTVIILGSGAYHIGSSVEFDWCCVNTATTLRRLGYHTVMLNYNPETVSTDYDESDKLIFDEISVENVTEIYHKLHPLGVIVSMGGQVANNIALRLHQANLKILGTSPESIDRAENRSKFSQLLDHMNIDQPIWKEVTSHEAALAFAQEVCYPVLVRPSYVLSGAAMAVAFNEVELGRYLQRAIDISPEQPTVISKFLENAKEIEMDAVAHQGEIVAYAISEHVENAGVHSGDATLVLPPQRTYLETMRQIRQISTKIAASLSINGPFNIQFIAKQNEVKVIECNLRASRSFPFVSKILKQNFIDLATRTIMGRSVEKIENPLFELNYVGVKAPQFSFTRLVGADPILGVEMASTGEVGCLGNDFDEAFLLALISIGYTFPIKTVLLSTGSIESKAELLESTRFLMKQGIKLYATRGTAKFLKTHGVPTEILHWPLSKGSPKTVDYIKSGKIDLVINIPKNYQEEELTNDYIIRRTAVDYNVMLISNRQLAMRLIEALARKNTDDLPVKSWREY
ncbi:carbamoyl-phosphate synthase (glutamine-hydrolyzing) large subunit [candidate division CSSED10-310 bacterium]|uniref:carbamoyl-phosphate synthase (ammonia) n=1 Tax=candidate division CSSED10-310 bacterium TaxID=2855610 RepID=A0ABV6Z1E2_UNCC1